MVEQFKSQSVELMVPSFRTQEVVGNHRAKIRSRKRDTDPVQYQERLFQAMHRLQSTGLVKKGGNGPHVCMHVERDKGSLVLGRQCDALHVRSYAGWTREKTLNGDGPALVQPCDKGLCRVLAFDRFHGSLMDR